MNALLLTGLLIGADPAPKTDLPKELLDLNPLVGTWRGEGEIVGVGKFTNEIVYQWNASKNFMKATYKMAMGGKIVWTDETIVGWDYEAKKLYFLTYASDGSTSRGLSTDLSDPKISIFEVKSSGPAAPPKEWKVTYTMGQDNRSMTIESQVMKDGKFEPAMTAKVKKVGTGK